MTKLSYRWLVILSAILITIAVVFLLAFSVKRYIKRSRPIKIGILHSLTGSLAITEKPIVDATLFAIDEINEAGGINGRQIKAIVADGKSETKEFEKAAVSLINDEKVTALFGPWLSTTRAALNKIVKEHNTLLFYPAHDEGLEESEHVIYMGSMPNQIVLPAITWCFLNLGKTFYLIGSDNLFPRVVSEIAKQHIQLLGGEIIAEAFVENERDIQSHIATIEKSQPNVIINILDAELNISFFNQLREKNITAEKIPTMSFSFSEIELNKLKNVQSMVGNYTAWTYFDSIFREENVEFVHNFRKKYGEKREITSNMESAYNNVHMWAKAVKEAHSTATDIVRPFVKKQVYNAPGGIVYLSDNQHAWRYAYIGKIRYDGSFDLIWDSKKQIKPLIYPPYKTKKEWERFVAQLT